jgi:hypothetical protein
VLHAIETVAIVTKQDATYTEGKNKLNKRKEDRCDTGALAEFLAKFFLGIMDFINARLRPKEILLAEKENALRSLEVLIQLIGPHLNSFRLKVMATLKLVLQFPTLVPLACKVWHTFVTSLDAAQLGPILSRIVVDLV